jgi:hypothetical protein
MRADGFTWQPKSPFFKAIMAKVEQKKVMQEVTLYCPCCGQPMKKLVSIPPQDR